MKELKVKFNNRKNVDFVSELRERVDGFFKDKNLSQHANSAMIFKTVVLLSVTFAGYFTIILFAPPVWVMLGIVVIMGFGFAGIGFSIGHDALHGAYSANPKVNRLLGYSFNLIGANDYIWRIQHNMKHHTYTNIYTKDDDLESGVIMRFSPNAPWRKIHQYQVPIAITTYCLLSLAWIFAMDFDKLVRYNGNGSPNASVKHPKSEVAKLIFFKVFYLSYMLALPMIILPVAWWVVLVGFLIMHVVTGLTLSLVFQLAHVVEMAKHPVPEQPSGLLDNAWAVHQMETTANFGTRNKFLTWYVGGLNFQVEHHLFPNICSVHYLAISPIVKEVAEKYGVPYNVMPSFTYALIAHFRFLHQLGRKPDPVTEGKVKIKLAEAVATI